MYKTNHQFVHWFEFAHISTDPPDVGEIMEGEIPRGEIMEGLKL